MKAKFSGARLAARRKVLGKTQAQFAKECGVGTMMVRRWESGKCVPSVDYFYAINRAADTTQAYLCGLVDDPRGSMFPLTTLEIDAVSYWRNADALSKEARTAMYKLTRENREFVFRTMIDLLKAQEALTGTKVATDRQTDRLKPEG